MSGFYLPLSITSKKYRFLAFFMQLMCCHYVKKVPNLVLIKIFALLRQKSTNLN